MKKTIRVFMYTQGNGVINESVKEIHDAERMLGMAFLGTRTINIDAPEEQKAEFNIPPNNGFKFVPGTYEFCEKRIEAWAKVYPRFIHFFTTKDEANKFNSDYVHLVELRKNECVISYDGLEKVWDEHSYGKKMTFKEFCKALGFEE